MNSIHIEFEDPAHLQSQIAYLYERICEPVGRGIASIGLFDDQELRDELARRNGAANETATPAPAAEKKPTTRKRLAAVSPAPEPTPEPEPQPEPEPEAAALPAEPEPVDVGGDAVAPVIPSQDDLQMVMGYIVATNGADGINIVRDIMSRVANAKSLKTAKVETWPELMRVMLDKLGMDLEAARSANEALQKKEVA